MPVSQHYLRLRLSGSSRDVAYTILSLHRAAVRYFNLQTFRHKNKNIASAVCALTFRCHQLVNQSSKLI